MSYTGLEKNDRVVHKVEKKSFKPSIWIRFWKVGDPPTIRLRFSVSELSRILEDLQLVWCKIWIKFSQIVLEV